MNSTDEATVAVIAVILGFAVFYLAIALAAYVLMSLCLMSFFRKVGVEPWIAWVPIYNLWKWLEIGGQRGWLALLVLVPYGSLVTTVFLCIGMYRTGRAFGKEGAFLLLGIFLPFLWALLLGSRDAVYRPETFAAYGWPPPLAGFGAVQYPAG